MKTENIIKAVDHQVITDYLLNEDEFFNNDPKDYLVSSWEVYKSGFSERNNISFENLVKAIKEHTEEIDEEGTERFLNLVQLQKALSPTVSFTEGIVYALRVSLDRFYYRSKWIFEAVTGIFEDPNKIRSINLTLLFSKMVKDDLKFITYASTGEVATVPLTLNKAELKKYYETYVSSYDIETCNDIYMSLQASISLLEVFINLIPDNEDFKFFVQTLTTCLELLKGLNLKEILLEANLYNLISILPKEVKRPAPVLALDLDESIYKKYSGNLDINIKKSSQGLITGIVLEPGDSENRDLQKQYISAEEIEKAMIYYMTKHQNLGLMHESLLKSDKDSKPQALLIENYIAKDDISFGDELVKAGTWIQTWQILDKKLKKKVDSGEYEGFSIGGTGDIITDDIYKEIVTFTG